MKPIGPIPPDFATRDGKLLIGARAIAELIEEAGDTPLFIYDFSIIAARIARLRDALPAGVAIHYAIKANPFAPLLRAIGALVDGFDIASAGELAQALDGGMSAAAISFAGPGKRDCELEAALAAGATINLESEGEAARALAVAERLSVRPRLAVRINPDFELRGSGMRMGGGAKPFGVDADRAAALVRRIVAAGADYRGLHIFAGSQSLDPQAIAEAQANGLALAGRVANESGAAPPLVNLGGGFGIPYFAGDQALDVELIGARLGEALAAAALPGTAFALELGRWLVGEAGVYLTRIVDRKTSHGRTFLITDGGMHHQLGASGNLGAVVRRNYPVAIASRFGAVPEEEASITGCLCTPLDRLADEAALPRAEVGDVVAVFVAGAYGLTASPQAFLGHPPARELLV